MNRYPRFHRSVTIVLFTALMTVFQVGCQKSSGSAGGLSNNDGSTSGLLGGGSGTTSLPPGSTPGGNTATGSLNPITPPPSTTTTDSNGTSVPPSVSTDPNFNPYLTNQTGVGTGQYGWGQYQPFNVAQYLANQQAIAKLYCSVYGSYNNPDTKMKYILGVFIDALGRSPNQSDIDLGLQTLNVANASTRLNWVWGVLNSSERRKNVVTLLYWVYLHRLPDAGGLQYYMNSLAAGGPYENVMVSILGSYEYFQRYQANPRYFIISLYRNVLGRTRAAISEAEIQGWMNQYSANGGNRVEIAKGFVNSQEAVNGFVTGTYQTMLGRAPTAAELANWWAFYQQGNQRLVITAYIMAGDEYFNYQLRRFANIVTGFHNYCN